MTRREFLRKAAKVGAVAAAAGLAVWLVQLARSVVPALREGDARGVGWGVLLFILFIGLSVVPPMLVGMAGGAIGKRRPGRAGAIAGVVCLALLGMLLVVSPGLRQSLSNLGTDVGRTKPTGLGVFNACISLAWWAFWGSIGGDFVGKYRAGRAGEGDRRT